MSPFDHTDAAFAADAPALAPTKPPLPFVRASRRGLPSWSGQDDPPHATLHRRLFVLGRRESAIASRDIRGPIEDREVPIQRRRPQRHIGGPSFVHLVRRDDLMLGFLNRHELAEFRGLGDLAFANGFCVRLEDAQDLVGDVCITTEQARTGLVEDATHQRLHLLDPLARLDQGGRDQSRRRLEPLADAAHHR